MTTTDQKRRNQKIRVAARQAVRHAHKAEFYDIYQAEKQVPGRGPQAAYNAAEGKLAARYPGERKAASEAARQLYGWPKGVGGFRKKVSLCKTVVPGRRRTNINPIDALILFDRHMTAKEIATYDNCTQRAVIETLVPLLYQRGMTSHGIADRLDIWAQHVERVAA